MAMGFFCFLPYPALPVGGASALQLGDVLCILACVPLLFRAWPAQRRPFWMYPLIIAPLVISTTRVAAHSGTAADLGLCLKTAVAWAVSGLALIATQRQAPGRALDLLTGIALATLLHAAIGAWQFYCFNYTGTFPLAELYVNPSFLSVQDNATVIARWVRRPFGLFPEPSAMAASLAPWVLFWTAERLGLVRLRQEPARWQRVLFAAAAAGGLGLIILSQSGHAGITLACLVLLVVAWLRRCRATAGTYLTLLALVFVALPCALYFGSEALGERLGGKSVVGNSSWEERSQSLIIGLRLLLGSDFTTAFFGMGAGLSAPALWDVARIDAVFSVLLTYVYETGIVGALACAAVAGYLLKVWRATRFDLVFACVGVTWLVGVTLTTSYQQLLSIWIVLGWLSVWPAVCVTAAEVSL
jgi:hypothetical protein